MTGTEFLKEAREIFPEAKKVLLTAYADTEAAISSINQVGLDYYLLKPWDPHRRAFVSNSRRFAGGMEFVRAHSV